MTRRLNTESDRHPLSPRTSRLARWVVLLLALLVVAGPILRSRAANAQEAAPETPTGIVRVTSAVRGAAVFIDNEPAGDAPVTRYLPVGSHTIRVVADAFDPYVRKVDVVAGTTLDVDARLQAGTGTVEFVVQPIGAVLFLNGKEEGRTPARLRDLRDGDYKYRLEAPGHEPEDGTFTFKRGKNLLINTRLKSTAGLLEVTTRPDGARVWLDGVSVGTTPLALQNVTPGPHVLRLEHNDTATVLRKVDNSDGSKAVIEARLPTTGARLTVETGEASATVKLNGDPIGQGDTVRVALLERGRYPLEVSAPGHQSATTTIEVPASGKLTLRTKLEPEGAAQASKVEPARPLTGRWTFWAAIAAGAGAAGATAAIVATADGDGDGDGETEGPDLIVELP